MADWFAKLMQRGRDSKREEVERKPESRDPRYDGIVQMLRDREAEDREAREKRERWYRQTLESDAESGGGEPSPAAPVRLHKFSTKVPCRVTPEARALLEQIRRRFSGCAVSFQQVVNGRQAVMLTAVGGTERKQIGWVEHHVETDPRRCNVRNQGLTVETDEGSMLVMRFCYPSTPVRMTSKQLDGERAEGTSASVSFTEIRPALEQRPAEKSSSPRLVWLTRPEIDAIKALQSRDYEAFYVRFKLELQAAIWSSLSGLLASAPASRWHRGTCYTVVTEPDATMRRIHQRTVDDGGHSIDIGLNRTYDAAPATDILLLYLEGDILADVADIYFTLQSLNSSNTYFLKEEFFTVIRRFWASAQSLASRYGSDLATVVRMSQRAIPMPAQAPFLRQDWINLRQSLVDRYGKGGRSAAALVGENVYRPLIGPLGWPFSSFPAGEINLGLRVVYRQEWRHLGTQRGDVIRTVPPTASRTPNPRAQVETTIEHGDSGTSLGELVRQIRDATVETMKWPQDLDGSIHTGVRALSLVTEKGLESDSRESSRDVSMRLDEIGLRLATETGSSGRGPGNGQLETVVSEGMENCAPSLDADALTYVYSKLQNQYEVLTQPAEIQNVVLVAEKLPVPAEIDAAWVRRHDWILSKVLLDESYREALNSIREETPTCEPCTGAPVDGEREELGSKRDRFYAHLRANILHYQRAIWRQEDPQQRSMRYRKLGKKVPLEWRFELEMGAGRGTALTIEELGDRLSATNVDGQFAAYSGGREADLDQVIDAAGPIGYYGNYAIYGMRPEFGSDEFFSMLHFFKSPFLYPSSLSGMPEVEDPEQIQFAERSVDGGPSDAPHQFRRERARRVALDTDGVVIDVIREADAPADVSNGTVSSGLDVVAVASELVLDGTETELLRIDAPNDVGSEWLSLSEGEAPSSLRAGHAPEEAERWISVGQSRAETLGVCAQRPDNAEQAEAVIVAQRDDGEPRLSFGEQRPENRRGESGILPRPPEAPARGLVAGRARDPQCSIVTRDTGELRITAAASVSKPKQRAIRSTQDENASADASEERGDRDLEPAILPHGKEEGMNTLSAGAAHETPRISARISNEEQSLWIGNGRALDLKAEPGIVAQTDGERALTLLTGRAQVSDGEAGIHGRDEEALRLTAVDGGKAAHPHEKAILAGGDDEWITNLLAGSNVGATHERVILAQEDEWLRPSLVAG